MKRYIVTKAEDLRESELGNLVSFDDYVFCRKIALHYKSILRQISNLPWYDIDSGPKMAAKALDED